MRLHTHLAETEDENGFCLETIGCRPLDYLEECGWLGDRVWLAHGIHFNAEEIARLAAAGAAVTPLRRAAIRCWRRACARSMGWKAPG